jgi:hypothetical protein
MQLFFLKSNSQKILTIVLLLSSTLFSQSSIATNIFSESSLESSVSKDIKRANLRYIDSSLPAWINLELGSAVTTYNNYVNDSNNTNNSNLESLVFISSQSLRKGFDKSCEYNDCRKSFAKHLQTDQLFLYEVNISSSNSIEIMLYLYDAKSKSVISEYSSELQNIVELDQIEIEKIMRHEVRELMYLMISDEDYDTFFAYKKKIENQTVASIQSNELALEKENKSVTVKNGILNLDDFIKLNNGTNLSFFIKSSSGENSTKLILDYNRIYVVSNESQLLIKVDKNFEFIIEYHAKTSEEYVKVSEQLINVLAYNSRPKAFNVNFTDSSYLTDYNIVLNGKDDNKIVEYVIVDYPNNGTIKQLGGKDSNRFIYSINQKEIDTQKWNLWTTINDSFTYNTIDDSGQINRSPGTVSVKIDFANNSSKNNFTSKKTTRKVPKNIEEKGDWNSEDTEEKDGPNLLLIGGGLLVLLLGAAGGGGGGGGGGDGGGSSGGSTGGIDIGINLP